MTFTKSHPSCLSLKIVLRVSSIINSKLWPFVHNRKNSFVWNNRKKTIVLHISQSKCAFYWNHWQWSVLGNSEERSKMAMFPNTTVKYTMTWQIIIKIQDIRAVGTGRCRVTATRTTNSSMQPRSLVYLARL